MAEFIPVILGYKSVLYIVAVHQSFKKLQQRIFIQIGLIIGLHCIKNQCQILIYHIYSLVCRSFITCNDLGGCFLVRNHT